MIGGLSWESSIEYYRQQGHGEQISATLSKAALERMNPTTLLGGKIQN